MRCCTSTLRTSGCTTDYVRTKEGYEVDFFTRDPEGNASLIQVCTDVSDPETLEREMRALASTTAQYRGTTPLLLTFDTQPPQPALSASLRWQPAIAWLLGDKLPRKPARRGWSYPLL